MKGHQEYLGMKIWRKLRAIRKATQGSYTVRFDFDNSEFGHMVENNQMRRRSDVVRFTTSPDWLATLSKRELRALCGRLMPIIGRKFRKKRRA